MECRTKAILANGKWLLETSDVDQPTTIRWCAYYGTTRKPTCIDYRTAPEANFWHNHFGLFYTLGNVW